MAEGSHDAIETFQAAGLSFPPDASTAAAANVSAAIYAEASPNAERFYLRRDYHFEGAPRFEQARPMTRRLMAS